MINKVDNRELEIEKNKFDINFKFYSILKHLVQLKLSEKQIEKLLNYLNNITAQGDYIFVAQEIYQQSDFLKKMKNIFPSNEFSLTKIKSLK